MVKHNRDRTLTSLSLRLRVTAEMTASFFDSNIHPIYATFAIVEHAEYISRCLIRGSFALDEDAVGLAVKIEHRGAAPIGTIVTLRARLGEVSGPRITCHVSVTAGDRAIAEVVTEQQVMKRSKVEGMYR